MPDESNSGHRAWIGLGSNIGDGPSWLDRALDALGRVSEIQLVRCSGYYRSPPWGMTEQDDFTNAVCEVRTELQPQQLLAALLAVEDRLGRRRDGVRWGPRTIDLDLLCFDERMLSSETLVLPHPRMHERAFVLLPLLELDPEFEIPGIGSAQSCLEALEPAAVVPPPAN